MKNFHQDNQSIEAKSDIRVAYFSAEYALSPSLPIYAGGLGVLAGDHVREAAAQKLNLIPIGLLYRNAQSMLVSKEDQPKQELFLFEMKNDDGSPLTVSVPIGERVVTAKAWKWEKEGVKVYLLDANVPDNDPRDREITKDLYADNRELRLKQEMLLGIGGFELLKAVKFEPTVYHMNEGHSAFVALAVTKEKMQKGRLDFGSARELAKKEIFFTNHTLILEGQEMFTRELIQANLEAYAKEMAITSEDIWALGSTKDNSMFSMTAFAFHMSAASNAVSVIHGEKAEKLWPEDHPTAVVTNGIYIPRWDKIGDPSSQGYDVAMWDKHQENKRKLLEYIEKETGEKWYENVLLFGWARRFVEYKQPLLILDDIKRIRDMMTEKGKEFRIVYAGPTGRDPYSNPLIERLYKMIDASFKGLVVFLPNYNTDLSGLLTAGCDVWLNTPVIGREACGTSGMKAALNGALPLSTRDGWIAEVDLTERGWVIDEPEVNQKLLHTIEKEIVPMYYSARRSSEGAEEGEWLSRMQSCRTLILEQFSATRMLNDYMTKLYEPISKK